ncbi:MAG: Transcription termination factor Rho [Prosthecobacter sp.]|nr:Transcription termination factor Rho [Prosthecobacter sp.]
MSDEIQPAEAPKKKATAKKAAAKKAPVKKTAAKKAPAKKAATPRASKAKAGALEAPEAAAAPELELQLDLAAAPEIATAAEEPVKKKTRRTALQKKAAEILAKMQDSMAAAHVAPATSEAPPPPAPVPAPAPQPPAVQPAPAPAPVAAAAPAPVPATPSGQEPDADDEGGADEAATPSGEGGSGRKKTRWERWKERRERFKAEKLARRMAQQGGGHGGGHANGSAPSSNGRHQPQEDEAPPSADVVLGPPEAAEGVLELNPKGHGFLRMRDRMFAQHPLDPFVHGDTIRQLGLREGMHIKGTAQKGPRGLMVTSISEVNGRVPESVRDLPLFEELKAVNPNKRIQFETTKERITTRVIDMFTPVGRGQRGLIVAPPRTGKTTLLQHIAESIVQNHPGMHLIILLVDERPEEVTEFKRIFANAEVYASSNDQDVRSHTRIASFAIERAKRLVEAGEHVFMLMDSITRLARAFNNAKSGGATMSGGMAVGGMEIPRRLFAAARNTRGAGSLTILATALIETGSRMDDVIFLEFKGTGNMELVLDRKLAEQYYYPAVNIFKSGTRREELLLPAFQLDKIHMLRRGLAGGKPIDAIQRVITLCERYPSNAQMLVDLPGKAG